MKCKYLKYYYMLIVLSDSLIGEAEVIVIVMTYIINAPREYIIIFTFFQDCERPDSRKAELNIKCKGTKKVLENNCGFWFVGLFVPTVFVFLLSYNPVHLFSNVNLSKRLECLSKKVFALIRVQAFIG